MLRGSSGAIRAFILGDLDYIDRHYPTKLAPQHVFMNGVTWIFVRQLDSGTLDVGIRQVLRLHLTPMTAITVFLMI